MTSPVRHGRFARRSETPVERPAAATPQRQLRRLSALSQTVEAAEGSGRIMALLLASISLLVGGISIMNILFVSVTERTREIGLRMAIGAQRLHVLLQFLAESVFISVRGGAPGRVSRVHSHSIIQVNVVFIVM